MDIHRINGLKFNFDRLTDDELSGIRGHLVEQHQRVTDEINVVEDAIFARTNDQLPFDAEHTGAINYERALGHAMLSGEITATEAVDAMGRFIQES